MKKIMLIALVALFGIQSAQAQTPTFRHDNNRDTAEGYKYTGVLDINNKIVNISPDTIRVRWRVVDTFIRNGWTFESLCDNYTCYFSTDILGGQFKTTDPILANAKCDMKASFNATNALENTYATVMVSELDQASGYSKNSRFIAYKGTLGTTQIIHSREDITLFPNPVTGNVLNVIYSPSLKVKTIGVYNVIGKLIAIYKTSDDRSAKLTDINKLSSGVYFLRLQDADGKVVGVKKFTNQ